LIGEDALGELKTSLKEISRTSWPGQLLYGFAKNENDDQVLSSANSDQQCEGLYFIALWKKAQGKLVEAKQHLNHVLQKCERGQLHFVAAESELNAKPAPVRAQREITPRRLPSEAQAHPDGNVPPMLNLALRNMKTKYRNVHGPSSLSPPTVVELVEDILITPNGRGAYEMPFNLNVCVHQNSRVQQKFLFRSQGAHKEAFVCDGVGGGSGNRPAGVTQQGTYTTQFTSEGDVLVFSADLIGSSVVESRELRGRMSGGGKSLSSRGAYRTKGRIAIKLASPRTCKIVSIQWNENEKVTSSENTFFQNEKSYSIGPRTTCEVR
jgi:hypothetical protein